MAALHCFIVTVALPWKDDTSIFMPTPMSCLWKDQVAEAGTVNQASMDIYITADSTKQYEFWKTFLECHIARHHFSR
jgi:hypothetical protein